MLKQWFQSSPDLDAATERGVHRNNSVERVEPVAELATKAEPVRDASVALTSDGSAALGRFAAFEEIYRSAPVKTSKTAFGILKVAEMVNSSHLSALSQDAKRCSLLMALDAMGVEVEDLLQDAMVRQRALNDYEEAQQKKLKEFEAAKIKENSTIQAELDRLSAVYMSRIQANLDEVARQEDNFRLWKKRKQQESESIAEAAAFCAPQGSAINGGLAATLARCSAEAVAGARR
jgi:hypothetical protein